MTEARTPPGGLHPLAEDEALLESLLAQAPFPFALFDTGLRCVMVNAALAPVAGRPPSGVQGLAPGELAAELAPLEETLRAVLDGGSPLVEHEMPGPPAGDDGRHYLATAYPVAGQDGRITGVGVALLDVTERRRAADQLALQARQQAAVVELGLSALRRRPLSGLLDEAVTVLTEVLDVEHGALFRAEGDGAHLALVAVAPPHPELVGTLTIGRDDGSQAGYTLRVGHPVVTDDLPAETRYSVAAGAGEADILSAVTVVVTGPLRSFGVLGAYSERARRFSDDDVRFVQAVANIIGTAVEGRRAERALHSSDQRLRLAQEAGRMGVWEWDLRAGTIVWSEALERLYGIASGGFEGSYEDFRRRVHPDDAERIDATLARAVKEGVYETEHRIIRDDDGTVRWIVARGDVVRDEAGGAVGMVGINIDITRRKAVEQERAELLEREQRARGAAERAHERLTFLSEATVALSSSLDTAATLRTITRLAVSAVDACIVDLVRGDELVAAASAHRDPGREVVLTELRRRYPPLTSPQDPTHAVLRDGASMLFDHVSDAVLEAVATDARHLELLRSLDISSGICVPLTARGRVLGTLSLTREGSRPVLDRDDLTLAEELARRAALAIDNARLYDEAQRNGERFRRMAETLQASLLPPHLPSVGGMELAATYRPAAEGVAVGGDFYDVFALADEAWGVVIGDVQGKGTEAATFTGLARHTIRTAAIQTGPSQTLGVLNEVLLGHTESGDDGRFCTVIYGRLDPSADGAQLELVSGGHPPAIVRRAGGKVETAGGGGTLVGMLETLEVVRASVRLERGDAVVLYTDGVTEARGGREEFGDARLRQAVRAAGDVDAAGLVTAVEHAVMTFSGGQIRDDIAVLVLRVLPDASGPI